MAFIFWVTTALLTLSAKGLSIRQRDVAEVEISVSWDQHIAQSRTSASLQAVEQPPMYRGSPTHDAIFNTLRESSADYIRFIPWYPYPVYAVAELEAPVFEDGHCSTSWNFTLLDQAMADFFNSTPNVKRSICISTTPAWMWILNSTYTYPTDPNVTDFSYNNGTELRDPTYKEISDYFARIVSWYTRGGFTDECGVYHKSGHNYTFDIFEILEEIDYEHEISAEYYTEIYDAIVTAIRSVSPETKFVGLNLASESDLHYFEFFLNHTNHKPGIPIDYVAYHLYAYSTNATEGPAFPWSQAENWTSVVIPSIQEIRDRLSPETEIFLPETGTILTQQAENVAPTAKIPDEYWVWSGGIWAYLWSYVIQQGYPGLLESQLSGILGNFPDVSLINQTTGGPNARLRTLQLIQANFGPGDDIYKTISSNTSVVHAQAIQTCEGKRKLLVINKETKPITISPQGFHEATAQIIDLDTQDDIWRTEDVNGDTWEVPAYATVVLTTKS